MNYPDPSDLPQSESTPQPPQNNEDSGWVNIRPDDSEIIFKGGAEPKQRNSPSDSLEE